MRIVTKAVILSLALLAPSVALSDDGESQAESWGLSGEEKARFSARVVDLLCELTGDCPDDCGAGARQLGLLDDAGKLIPVAKNVQAQFNGAVPDLLPYCGEMVEVDGLLVGENIPARIFQVQLIRGEGETAFRKANSWTDAWNARFPDAPQGSEPWFRRDARVTDLIKKNGYLGLGPEADDPVIDEWY